MTKQFNATNDKSNTDNKNINDNDNDASKATSSSISSPPEEIKTTTTIPNVDPTKIKNGNSAATTTVSAASTTTTTIETSSSSSSATKSIFRGTLITLVLRIVSFGCTQATFRVLDPTTLGKAHIQLELLLTTVLFVSREGFRLALTKSGDDGDDVNNINQNHHQSRNKKWVNVAWLTIPVVSLISFSTMFWHIFIVFHKQNQESNNESSSSSSSAIPLDYDYLFAGILYCLASWIEGCAEPAVLYFLRQLNVPQRASAESLAAVVKTFATILALRYSSNSYPVTAFGLAQLVYAIVYTTYLYSQAWNHLPLPSITTRNTQQGQLTEQHQTLLTNTKDNFLDYDYCRMTLIFTVQGFFKHLLTEADRIVLTAVADNYNQGVYAMGSAYGGMAARILLQPLEENARLLWSRLAANSSNDDKDNNNNTPTSHSSGKMDTTTPTTNEKTDTKQEKMRNVENNKQERLKQELQLLKQSYTTLVKFVLYLGLLFGCVAVHYTNLLLCLLAGRKWGENEEAALVLSAFCVYTAFLAANGMTEAFVYAVANSGMELTRLGMAHTATGIVFAMAAPSLVSTNGTVGLVMANCVAMTVRSIYSIHFAAQYFQKSQYTTNTTAASKSTTSKLAAILTLSKELVPHPLVLASFAVSFVSTKWSLEQVQLQGFHQVLDIRNKEWLAATGQHLAVGISCVIGIGTMATSVERPFFTSLKSMIRAKHHE